MTPIQINDFWVSPDQRIGAWSTDTEPPTAEQIQNANLIRSFFLNEGWSLNAICGMLGCMQGESTLNPAYIQATHRSRLPNGGTDLSSLPNAVMINFYAEYYGDMNRGYAIGLVQWDGYSNRSGRRGQKLVNYCVDNNIDWADGWSQMYRLRGEWQYDVTNQTNTFMYRVYRQSQWWDFGSYVTSTMTPEDCAYVWTVGYERNAGGLGFRGTNARWWYDYFNTDPDAPPVVPPEDYDDPVEEDPEEPPFDPDDPAPPVPPGQDFFPAWFLAQFSKKKRSGKRWLVT